MRTLLRPANLALVLTYLALSLVPLFPLVIGLPVANPSRLAGMAVFAWIFAWALFKRPAYFHWLLLPAFLALPAELYLYTHYGQGISTHHLGIMAETSPLEAREYLGGRAWLMLAVIVAAVAWWAGSYRAALATRDLDWTDRSRWLVLACLLTASSLFVYGMKTGPAPKRDAMRSDTVAPALANTLTLLPRWAQPPFDINAFARSWPFGVGVRALDFYKERVYLADLHGRSSSFRFGASQADPARAPDVIVMVLGESARFDRWSINGYARNTNPLLSREANLVSFQDLITSVSATRLSVPVIISRKPAMQSLKDGFTEKSFLSAFKEAGYKTFWLSNQISFGKFDTPVSVFAKEADTVNFLNLGGFTDNSNYDEVLFRPFSRALLDPAPKKLIVLHTLGSHWNYAQRYPARFDQYKPSLQGVPKPVLTDGAIEAQLNNSYDNSILYTDWFVAGLVQQLKDSARAAALMYVADHGQTLYDGACRQVFHGHNNQHEFHVPAFAWYSDAYGARFPDKVAQLRAHRAARLSTENVFHTLVDLGDIRYPGENLQRSIASSKLAPHTRYVDSYGWTDYDDARMQGDCREVIANGKPLPRR